MNLNFILLLIGILVVFLIIYFSEKGFKFKIPKRKSGTASNSKPKEKKPFFSEGFKEAIRWSIFSLICLILMVYLFNFGVSSYRSMTNNRYNANITTHRQKSEKVLGYVKVSLSKEYGKKIRLYEKFPSNARFQFINATVDYTVINKNGEKAFAVAGQNASGQLGFSNGNIWLRFKSQNEGKGNLRIKIYLKK